MLLAVDIGNSTISTGLFGLDGELRFLASYGLPKDGGSDLRGSDEPVSALPFPL